MKTKEYAMSIDELHNLNVDTFESDLDPRLVEYGYTAPCYWARDIMQTKRFFTQRKFLAYLAVERLNGMKLQLVGTLPPYKGKKK
jgi:hypothetical protein